MLNIENASFTPLVFNINGGMARECKKFFSRLTEMVAEKRNVHVSVATSFIRTKLSLYIENAYRKESDGRINAIIQDRFPERSERTNYLRLKG